MSPRQYAIDRRNFAAECGRADKFAVWRDEVMLVLEAIKVMVTNNSKLRCSIYKGFNQ